MNHREAANLTESQLVGALAKNNAAIDRAIERGAGRIELRPMINERTTLAHELGRRHPRDTHPIPAERRAELSEQAVREIAPGIDAATKAAERQEARDRLTGKDRNLAPIGPDEGAPASMTVERGPRGFFVAIGRGSDAFRVSTFYTHEERAYQERDTKAREYRAAGWNIAP